jgi:hypothetical protein
MKKTVYILSAVTILAFTVGIGQLPLSQEVAAQSRQPGKLNSLRIRISQCESDFARMTRLHRTQITSLTNAIARLTRAVRRLTIQVNANTTRANNAQNTATSAQNTATSAQNTATANQTRINNVSSTATWARTQAQAALSQLQQLNNNQNKDVACYFETKYGNMGTAGCRQGYKSVGMRNAAVLNMSTFRNPQWHAVGLYWLCCRKVRK